MLNILVLFQKFLNSFLDEVNKFEQIVKSESADSASKRFQWLRFRHPHRRHPTTRIIIELIKFISLACSVQHTSSSAAS